MSAADHPSIGLKKLRRLVRRRSARLESGLFVIEGSRAVADALTAQVALTEVFAEAGADAAVVQNAEAAGVPVTRLPSGRLSGIVDTWTPQPLAAVAPMSTVDLHQLDPSAQDLIVVLVDVNDPGNVGTLLRVAEASGAEAVLCLGETADPFGPKSVRASAGSVFMVQVLVDREATSTMQTLATRGWECFATSPRADALHDEVDLTGPVAVVLGSEAHGLADEVMEAVTQRVRIPMAGRSESLNVAMAGAVICFEAARQRRQARL